MFTITLRMTRDISCRGSENEVEMRRQFPCTITVEEFAFKRQLHRLARQGTVRTNRPPSGTRTRPCTRACLQQAGVRRWQQGAAPQVLFRRAVASYQPRGASQAGVAVLGASRPRWQKGAQPGSVSGSAVSLCVRACACAAHWHSCQHAASVSTKGATSKEPLTSPAGVDRVRGIHRRPTGGWVRVSNA